MVDPCESVRKTCAWVSARSEHVSIDATELGNLATRMASETLVDPPRWDEGDWHYHADAASGGPVTAQYIFVLDSLNFCFWPSSSAMEYDTLATGLKRVLTEDATAFDAEKLMAVTPAQVSSWFAPHDMPNIDERVEKLHELGAVLAKYFDGKAYNLVAAARQSAVACVNLIVQHFPGFRDENVYKGRQIFLYKRAQICVGDLWAAYGQHSEGASPFAFPDIGALTCFADYRIPQLFRALRVFKYSDPLAALVDEKREVQAGSEYELEIRCCTVTAVEMLRAAINAARPSDSKDELTSVQVDWLLWQAGEQDKDRIAPHHRTLTVFY